MSGVEYNHVYACLDKSRHSVEHVGCRADCRAADKSALVVARGVGILHALLDILDRDESLETAVLADDRELLDLVLAQNALCLLKRGTHGSGDQVLLSHNL